MSPQVKTFAWINHTAHIRRVIFTTCLLSFHVAWAADATEVSSEQTHHAPQKIPRVAGNGPTLQPLRLPGVAGPGWRDWTWWQSP